MGTNTPPRCKWVMLILLIIFCLTSKTYSNTYNIKFRQISREENLPNNIVYDIIQDPVGFMWFGTQDGGLNRYDGAAVKSFTHDAKDQNTVASNNTGNLYIDSKGILWIGTKDGLNRQDPVTGKFRHFSHNPMEPTSISSSQISVIFKDKKGQLFLGTEDGGLNLFDPSTEQFKTYISDPNDPHSISGNHIISIFEDSEGTLWIGTYQNGLNRFDPERGIFTAIGMIQKAPRV